MTVDDRSTLAPSGEIKHDQAVYFLREKHDEVPHRQRQTGSNAVHSRPITPSSQLNTCPTCISHVQVDFFGKGCKVVQCFLPAR